MSDSSSSLKSPPKVLTTIGAQDLHQLGFTKSGVLRKQGKWERRLSQLGKVGEQFKWRQMYVVIAKGCMYVYDSEDSTSPKTAFSLYGYNRISRYECSQSSVKNAFQIEMPGESVRYRTFAAHSDEERKEWMCAIYKMMMQANSKACPSLSALRGYNYHELEEPIFGVSERKIKSVPAKSVSEESDSEDDDYDKIEEKKMDPRYRPFPNTRKELPPLPKEEPWSKQSTKQLSKSHSLPSPVSPKHEESKQPVAYANDRTNKPPVAPKPKPKQEVTYEIEAYEDATPAQTKLQPLLPGDYEFEGSDSATARGYLLGKPEGTFLTRLSNKDDSKVLMVVADNDVKQFKIYMKDNKFTVDQKDLYSSIKELIEHYRVCSLPNIATKLTNGYGYK